MSGKPASARREARASAVAEHRDGVRRGDRRLLAKTITLLESRRPDLAAISACLRCAVTAQAWAITSTQETAP